MSEEKRNHPRAKVLSMTVRYKSATVDDFVEHHSDNVSRGGIFIKTTSPFPPGTLLKFEIRIADDEAVLAGVGRVVWKRDEAAADDEPAGMGVKFIKLDEKSRALISRLIEHQGGGESKYDRGFNKDKAPAKPKKETLLGLGAIGADEEKAAVEKAKAVTDGDGDSDAGGGMFPTSESSEEDMPPPEERTVMKQAAELLEQALESAGGSMDELGAGLDDDADDGWGLDDDDKSDDDDKAGAAAAANEDTDAEKAKEEAEEAKKEAEAAKEDGDDEKAVEKEAVAEKKEVEAAEKKAEAKVAAVAAAKKDAIDDKADAKKEEVKKKAAVAKPAPKPITAHEPEEEEGGGKGLPILLAIFLGLALT